MHGKEILWYRPRVFPPFSTSTTYRLVRVSGISSDWRSITPTSGPITDGRYQSFVDAYGGYDVTQWPGYRLLADIQEPCPPAGPPPSPHPPTAPTVLPLPR